MKIKSYNTLSIIVVIAATFGCLVGVFVPLFLGAEGPAFRTILPELPESPVFAPLLPGIEEPMGTQDVDRWAVPGWWIFPSMIVGGFVFGGIAKLILHGLLEEMPEKPAPDWKTFSRKEWGIAAVCWLCLAAGLVVAILFGKDIPIAGGILPIFVGSIPLCAFGIVQDAKKKRRIGKRTETGTP